MKLEFEAYVLDIAEHVSEALGGTLDVSTTRWINNPSGKEQVKDATMAFYDDGKTRSDDVVLLISNPSYPTAVQADAARAREIAAQVSPRLADHISAPVYEGKHEAQTYAAVRRLSPLSDFRPVRLLQKRRATQKVLPWITALALETKEPREAPAEFQRYVVRPLEALCSNNDVSANVRDRANEYLGFVRKSKKTFFTSFQHGDFWIGNVFFERRRLPDMNPSLGKFTVIDWRGARLDGYPCMDWISFCSSLFRVGSRSNDELVSAYINKMGISKTEFQVYSFLALGRLSEELDQFPKERFAALCENTLAFIDAHSR